MPCDYIWLTSFDESPTNINLVPAALSLAINTGCRHGGGHQLIGRAGQSFMRSFHILNNMWLGVIWGPIHLRLNEQSMINIANWMIKEGPASIAKAAKWIRLRRSQMLCRMYQTGRSYFSVRLGPQHQDRGHRPQQLSGLGTATPGMKNNLRPMLGLLSLAVCLAFYVPFNFTTDKKYFGKGGSSNIQIIIAFQLSH